MIKAKQLLAGLVSAAMVLTSAGVTTVASTVSVLAATTYTVTSPTNVKLAYTGQVPDLMTDDNFAEITINTGAKLVRGTDYTVEASTAGPGVAKAVFTMIKGSAYENDSIADLTFTIEEASSTDSYATTIDASKFVYDGNALTADEVEAATTVLRNGVQNVTRGTEDGKYAIALDNSSAVNAGTEVKITITVNGTSYKYEQTVTIAKADLADLYLTGTQSNTLTYNGEAQNATFSNVTYAFTEGGTATALAPTDYEVGTCSNNINAGSEAIAEIKAKSASTNFTGTGTVKFTIGKFDLSHAYAKVEPASVVYTGEKQTPEFGLTVAVSNQFGAAVIPASDYKVTYPDASTNASTTPYKVTIEPKTTDGNYEESLQVDAYTITQASLKNIEKTDKKAIPAGTALTAENILDYYTFKLGNYELQKTDFTVGVTGNTAKKDETCTVTLTAAANGNFKDTYTFTYVTGAKTLAETYTSAADITYNGSVWQPTAATLGTLTVKDGTDTLATSEYDVVSYSNNKNAGTAIAVIKGKNEYEGNANVEFTIKPQTLTGYTVKSVTGITEGSTYYVGAEIANATAVLTNGSDLTLDASNVTVKVKTIVENKVTAVTVTPKGNYSGEAMDYNTSVPVVIADLENATVNGTIPAGLTTYDEAAIQKYITVTVGGKTIGTDGYSVSNIVRVPAAAAGSTQKIGDLGTKISFTITGKNPIIGEKKNCTIDVVQRDIADVVKADGITVAAATYTGAAQEPAVTVTSADSNAVITVDTDYTVSYSNNINAGSAAVVTITGKGNYTGTVTKNFTIAKATLAATDIKLTGVDTVEYTSGAAVDQSAKLAVAAADANSKLAFTADDYKITLVSGQTGVAKDSYVKYKVEILAASNNYNAITFNQVDGSKVVPMNVSNPTVTVEKTSLEVGTTVDVAALGTITVKVGDKTLTKDTDYTLSIEGETGKVTSELSEDEIAPALIVEFKGNYAGKTKVPFLIVAKTINIKDLSFIAPSAGRCVYSGNPVTLTVANAGKDILTEGTHYTIVYTDADGKTLTSAPVNVGTYTATIVATAAYGGETGNSITYSITQKNLSALEFKALVDKILVANVEYKGEATKAPVLYRDVDNCGKICQQDIVEPEFEVLTYDKEWTGDPNEKGDATIALKSDSNYAYAGTYAVKFTWEKGHLYGDELLNMFAIEDQSYTGAALEPAVKAIDPEAEDSWVTVKYYENNIDASTKTAKAFVQIDVPATNAKYYGGAEGFITFTILPAQIGDQTVTVADAAYTGKELTPAVTVKDADGKLLDLDKDYVIDEYYENINVGQGYVVISGIKNYTGTLTTPFTINKAASTITVKAKSATYTGKAVASNKAVVKGSTGAVTYKYYSDSACKKEIKASAVKNAGTYYVKATVAEDDNYLGKTSAAAKITIKQAANPLKIAKANRTAKASTLKTKAVTVTGAKVSKKGQGTVTWKKVKVNKSAANFTVAKKTGKITIKKGTAKGTYKVTVSAQAAGNTNYKKSGVKKAVVTITVK